MRDIGLTLRLTGYAMKNVTRNPRALVFTVAFPIVMLVLFASIFTKGGDAQTTFQGSQIDTTAYFTAGIIAYAITMACFSSLAIGLTTERESGQLKRFRGTPVPAWVFIAARVCRSILLVAVMVVALLLIAWLAYDVTVSKEGIAEIAVFTVMGTAAMCSLGVAITGVTNTADAASTIAPFSTVLLAFISGVFIPTDQLPDSLVQIGKVFPLAHLATGLQAAFDNSAVHINGENAAVLAVWGLAGIIVAARTFRWEPHAAAS